MTAASKRGLTGLPFRMPLSIEINVYDRISGQVGAVQSWLRLAIQQLLWS